MAFPKVTSTIKPPTAASLRRANPVLKLKQQTNDQLRELSTINPTVKTSSNYSEAYKLGMLQALLDYKK